MRGATMLLAVPCASASISCELCSAGATRAAGSKSNATICQARTRSTARHEAEAARRDPIRASSCEAAVVVPEAGVNEWEPTTIIHNDPPYDPATATGRAAAHTAEYMPVRRVQLLAAASTHAKARRR